MDPHAPPNFPRGFFARMDERPDGLFYAPTRLVTHIDDGAIAAVADLYRELGVDGDVLDLMSSWVSHFGDGAPRRLVGLGMNAEELARNPALSAWTVRDLNADPRLPFEDEEFDDVVCCVSIDYLTRPVDVLREVRRVLRPGGRVVVTFSNRLFPSKAVAGWLHAGEAERPAIVERYLAVAGGYRLPVSLLRTPPGAPGDPLWAVWAARAADAPG